MSPPFSNICSLKCPHCSFTFSHETVPTVQLRLLAKVSPQFIYVCSQKCLYRSFTFSHQSVPTVQLHLLTNVSPPFIYICSQRCPRHSFSCAKKIVSTDHFMFPKAVATVGLSQEKNFWRQQGVLPPSKVWAKISLWVGRTKIQSWRKKHELGQTSGSYPGFMTQKKKFRVGGRDIDLTTKPAVNKGFGKF